MKKMLVIFLLIIVCGGFLVQAYFKVFATNLLDQMVCYQTFEEFTHIDAYGISQYDKRLPSVPWQIETNIPSEFGDSSDWQVTLIREANNISELWLTREQEWDYEKNPYFLIYNSSTKTWEKISYDVSNSDEFVRYIYMTSDGTIWGSNWLGTNTQETIPILSKYNEQKKQFEFVTNSPQIKIGQVYELAFDKTNDRFWAVVDFDGLYIYEPKIDKTTKQADYPNFNLQSIKVDANGDLYFLNLNEKRQKMMYPTYHMYQDMLGKFSVVSKEFSFVTLPDKPWPIVGSPRITTSNQLWFGAIGYFDINKNSWHSIYPDLNEYIENSSYIVWSQSPPLILEDKEGVLWFSAHHLESKNGTAWYNPQNGKGCMFTNQYGKIVEDSQGQLWMSVEGNLYYLPAR